VSVGRAAMDALADMRAASLRGAHGEAALIAEALAPEWRATPPIALETARARMRQGRMAQAAAALSSVDAASATPAERLVVALELASLQVYRHAAIQRALDDSEAAFAAAAGHDIDAPDRAEAEQIDARIVLMAATYYVVDAGARRRAADRLSNIADVLDRAGRLDRALAARFTFAEQLDGSEARLDALAAFAARASGAGRHGIAAEALVARAAILVKSGASDEAVRSQLKEALTSFTLIGHVHGPIDVRRARAMLDGERGIRLSETLESCLRGYRCAEYPRGELTLLMDLSQLAHERGDTSAAQDYRRRCLTLAEDLGMGLVRDNFELAHADLLMRNGQYGAAIELAQAAIAADPPAFMVASYEQLMSSSYGLLGDDRASLAYARAALEGFARLGAEGSASNAAYKLAGDLAATGLPASWDAAEQLLRTWIAKDVARDDLEGAVNKHEQLARLQLRRASVAATPGAGNAHLAAAERRLVAGEEVARQLAGRAGAQRLGNLQQLRAQLLQVRGDLDGVEAAFRAALTTYESAEMAMEAANCRFLVGVLRLNRANTQLEPHFAVAEQQLREALDYYERAGMRSQAADTHFMFARLYSDAEPRVADELGQQLLDATLEHLHRAEEAYDAVRREYAVGSVLEAQAGKHALIARSHRIYELALELVCLRRPDPSLAWRWTQRSKARALADTLGGGTIAPRRLLAALEARPDALALVGRERELVGRIDKQPAERLRLRAQLAALHEEMSCDPQLADYLELRVGAAIEPDDLVAMAGDPSTRKRGIVFVDWIAVGDALVLIALRPGGDPALVPLAMTLSEVRRFVAENLGRNFRLTLRDAPALLRDCDALIAPLADLSAPDELLVLSPTGPLHALALHALELDGEPLVARNAVVFCPSLAVLRHCLARGTPDRAPRSAALFGDPSGDRGAAAELVRRLGERFATPPLVRGEVTRAGFETAVADRDLVHFQGHAKHDSADPLASHLVLADALLTAREVFVLRNLRATLVTLAACESAASVVATGDEPLGLIPAFLYAGAGSVLATLWHVSSRSTAQLMEHFYDAFEGGTIDKAQMLREAALDVRATPGLEAPYHWAPFVLYGDWH
jgi:CHAT domain-containing protein/tetratricopeptide (TPR) repeat protein